VVAWIGPETEDSPLAMSLLNQINTGIVPLVHCDNLKFKAHWKAIMNFSRMEYWGRFWIIQELVLPLEVLFCCGRDTLLVGETLLNVGRLGNDS
jgi:hypothetical protein